MMQSAIAWYRPNPFPKLIRIGTLSGLLMISGAIVMAVGIDKSGRVNESWSTPAIIIGVSMVITGVLNACFSVYHTLDNDSQILILSHEGIEYQTSKSQKHINWKDLNSAEFTNKMLILLSKDGLRIQIEHSFLGIKGGELAENILIIQRQILLGVPVRV